MDLKDIKAIIDLMKKNSISEFELEKQDFSHSIVIVLRWIIDDMCFGTGVTELLVPVGRRNHALITFH